MSVAPAIRSALIPSLRLDPFDRRCAELVASWVLGPREAYWLAPHTWPPIDARKVLSWAGRGRQALQLVPVGQRLPCGYGELNALDAERGEYWLGHLIVSPLWRGRGIGRQLVRSMLTYGFARLGAQRISLVVFDDNAPAIASYRSAGMYMDGFESHEFAAYGRRERLVRMVARRSWYTPG